MTSIEVLDHLRADLVAQRNEAIHQRDQYQEGGDSLYAHSFDMKRLGLEKAIEALDHVLSAELKAFNQR